METGDLTASSRRSLSVWTHVARVGAVIVAIALVLGGIGYGLEKYTPVGTQAREAWSIVTMPGELKKATFVSEEKTTSVLRRASGITFKKETILGTLVSADTRAPNSARIVLDSTGTYNLFLNGKNIYATTSPLAGVSVSPDGTMVAYAHGTEPLVSKVASYLTPLASFDSRSWSISVFTPASGARVEVGFGSSPLFVDSTHLLHFAPGGVFITDVKAGTQKFVLPGIYNIAQVGVLQSPDRTLVAWKDTTTKTITVYRVGTDALEKLASLAYKGGGGSYTLGNDAFFYVKNAPSARGIWKQGFEDKDAHKVGNTSSSYMTSRLLLGAF